MTLSLSIARDRLERGSTEWARTLELLRRETATALEALEAQLWQEAVTLGVPRRDLEGQVRAAAGEAVGTAVRDAVEAARKAPAPVAAPDPRTEPAG